jgi:NAD(P)-dependent dehydrogenase (short-subunit alcohol dehydrogenase family)
MMGRIAGRTAVVTGAGAGLGRVIALALAAAGARTILVGRTESRLAAVAAEVTAMGAGARLARCDVSDVAQTERLARELDDENISILINNAGVAGPVLPLIDIEPAEWDGVFASNVRSIYLMCRALLPAMIERGAGDIINLASVSGKRPLVNRTSYTASKMAVIGLTTTLAFEVAPYGIAVNSLSPGPVRGARMERNFRLAAEHNGTTIEQERQSFLSRAALGRMVEETEVGDAVIAMLSMTGLCAADIDLSAGMVGR